MKTKLNDPAFSNLVRGGGYEPLTGNGYEPIGMSKREYFAAIAEVPEFMIQAMAKNVHDGVGGSEILAQLIARMKVRIGDFLIDRLNEECDSDTNAQRHGE